MRNPNARRRHGRALALAGLLAGLLSWPPTSRAEQDLGPVLVSGEVQVGGREVTGDNLGTSSNEPLNASSQFDKYRDISSGIFGRGDLLAEDPERRYYLRLQLDDVAEDDQQYLLEGGRYGTWGLLGSFSEIPQVYSKQSLTPYSGIGRGLLTLPTPPPCFDRDIADAQLFDDEMQECSRPKKLKFRTIEGHVEAFYKPTPDWDLRAGYRILDKHGNRPDALPFGSAGGNFVNFHSPIDEVIHEGSADVQLVRDRWNLAFNYTGNFYNDRLKSVSVDNPIQAAAVDGTSDVGRLAAAPDNWAQVFSLSGAGLMPTSFPMRLAGTFAYGYRRQDQDFIPMTSNSALFGDPRLALPQNDLDGEVHTILGNLVLTARPTSELDFEARYRIYDYDNETDPIDFSAAVVNDRSVSDRTIRSIANSYRTQTADFELTYDVNERTSAGLGFEWEYWRRSNDRERRNLHTYSPTALINYRASWAQVRGRYTFSAGDGTGYDFFAPFEAKLDTSVSLNPLIKKYPQAEFLRHEFDLLSQFTPREDLDFSFSGGFSLADYDDSKFGLRDDERFNLGADASYRPLQRLGFSAFYTYDWIERQLRSASSGNNWKSKAKDRAHNGGIEMEVALIPDRLDWSAGYFIQAGRAQNPANGDAAGAVDYPTIEDILQAVTTVFRLYFTEYLELDVRYRYEDYDQKDFQYDQLGLTNVSSFVKGTQVTGSRDVFLSNPVGDYHAHIIGVSAIVSF